MRFSYSLLVQKCVSMKFIFNKIHYMNLWHSQAVFPPLHFQTLIDSTWEQWFGFRVSQDSQALQPYSSGQPTDKSKDKKYLSAWINWNVSENTSGMIFRNVRFGDDRIVRVFLTVSARQSFRVHVRRRKGKKPLWSAISEKTTTENKRKCLTGLFSLWQRCYKMPDCLINETYNLWPRSWRWLRYLSAFLLMKTILASPQEKHPTSFLFIVPPSLAPTGCMYECVSDELMSRWHQAKMLRNQDLAEYITWHASTGTCVSSYLAMPLPWQIKKINGQVGKLKKLTGKFANSDLHQAPFWFFHELEFPLFFITTIYTPDAHTQSYSTKRRNSLISSPKGTTQSQDQFFYLWLQNSDFSNFPFVNRSPKEISLRALNGVDVCRSAALWQSQTPVSISDRRCGLLYLDTFPPCNLTTPALSTSIWFSFINEVAQICNNKEYWHNLC